MLYRQMNPGEEIAVCTLVIDVFDEFVAPDYSEEGCLEFRKYVQPGALQSRSRANHFVLVAVAGERIVGMIEVRESAHVSLLFVDPRFHRLGISRELLRRSLEICLRNKPGLSEISVNSSPYAVKVYERLGFRRVGPERTHNGIKFTPMVREVRGRPD